MSKTNDKHKFRQIHWGRSLLQFVFVSFLLFACAEQSSTPTPTLFPTLTPASSSTPTMEPIGSTKNPVIIGLVGDVSDPYLAEAGQFLADNLTLPPHNNVTYRIVPNYHILVNEMREKNVHIYFLNSMTYLHAHSRNFADAKLLFNHFGLYSYGTQFFVHSQSSLFTYFDETTQANISDMQTALPQLQGKRPCFTSPDSLSGYLAAMGLLNQAGVQTQKPVFTYSASATVRAIYITGICDFGATYAIAGDPRTAEAVITDLSDVRNRVQILWRSDPIIPNLNLSVHPDLSPDFVQSLLTSFIVLGQTEEGKQWLSSAARYEIDDMMIIDDTYYDALRSILQDLDYDSEQFIGY